MKHKSIVELHVSPKGILDPEGRIPPIKLQDANQLLGLFREDEIALIAQDDLTHSKFPRDCDKLNGVIDISKGRIRWQAPPKG